MTQAPYEHIARIRVRAAAGEVAARVPPAIAEVTAESDSICLLVAGGNDLDAMAWHLAGVGFPFEVLEPPALRQAMADLAQRLVTACAP